MTIKIDDRFENTFTISEKVYQDFIAVSNDKNPLHTDESFAVSKGFKGRVMHGNILNCFLSYFIGECLPTRNVIIHKQDIQFRNPVYLNDQVLLEAVVTDVFESVNAVEFQFTFRNDERKTVAKGKFQIGILK
jgi:acyl dehydratase